MTYVAQQTTDQAPEQTYMYLADRASQTPDLTYVYIASSILCM